jgi:hypothetical protein
MTALEDLAAHDERLAEAQQRARAVGRDLAEHQAKIGELRQRKIDAHSRDDEQLAAKVRKQIDAAEAKVVDLGERQQGAEVASRRADSERTRYVAGWSARLSPTRSEQQRRSTSALTSSSPR